MIILLEISDFLQLSLHQVYFQRKQFVFHFMKCVTISQSTFFRHQRSFIEPAITNTWREKQDKIVQQLQSNGKPLSLGGDARCNSPGVSAKYGSYTVMDLKENLTVDIQLVQVCNYAL